MTGKDVITLRLTVAEENRMRFLAAASGFGSFLSGALLEYRREAAPADAPQEASLRSYVVHRECFSAFCAVVREDRDLHARAAVLQHLARVVARVGGARAPARR